MEVDLYCHLYVFISRQQGVLYRCCAGLVEILRDTLRNLREFCADLFRKCRIRIHVLRVVHSECKERLVEARELCHCVVTTLRVL